MSVQLAADPVLSGCAVMDLLYHRDPSARLRCRAVENLAISVAHTPFKESSIDLYGLAPPSPNKRYL